ncbi:hypothetical protein Zmor_001295 [Zophobas morio]|uniref:Uncharacterized protein n=1 Tax=Zophobas morio TaxID=2755281 RepID=A0AA38MP62_9CUCU|nr:hypothetical protein Zmor_001295 [Zophobas morio]
MPTAEELQQQLEKQQEAIRKLEHTPAGHRRSEPTRQREEKQLRKLINEMELGDRQPSQLFREMKALAGQQMNSEVVKTLWLQRLPPHVQLVLSASEGVPLEKMAEIADKLAEIHRSNAMASSINAIGATSDTTRQNTIVPTQETNLITSGSRYNHLTPDHTTYYDVQTRVLHSASCAAPNATGPDNTCVDEHHYKVRKNSQATSEIPRLRNVVTGRGLLWPPGITPRKPKEETPRWKRKADVLFFSDHSPGADVLFFSDHSPCADVLFSSRPPRGHTHTTWAVLSFL